MDIRSRIVAHKRVKASDLVRHPENTRGLNDPEQVEGMVDSFDVLGQIAELVVRPLGDGTFQIIDGELRANIAEHGEVDIGVTDLDADEARKAILALNRLAQLRQDDPNKLAALLRQQETHEGTGYTEDGLAEAMAEANAAEDTREDDPEAALQEGPVYSKRGEVYQLGRHRVYCGDYREADATGCDVLVFDPPYDDADLMGERFDGKWRQVLSFGDGRRAGLSGAGWGDLSARWLFVWDGGSSWYVRGCPLARMKLCWWVADDGAAYNEDGWHYGEPGDAKTVTNSRGTYEYEPDPRGKHLSDVYAESLVALHAEGPSHAKPLDWVSMLIGNCTTGDVFDPFLGSGTVLMAAEALGRKCNGAEIDPGAVDGIRRRYAIYTGNPDPFQ